LWLKSRVRAAGAGDGGHQPRRISLYQTLGFQTYGRRPNSFKLKSGGCTDELLMVLDLGNQTAAR